MPMAHRPGLFKASGDRKMETTQIPVNSIEQPMAVAVCLRDFVISLPGCVVSDRLMVNGTRRNGSKIDYIPRYNPP